MAGIQNLPNPFTEPANRSSLAETPAASARLKCGDAAGSSTPLGGTATAPGMARGSDFQSRAKATEGRAGMAAGTASVRRSTAGTGLRVGEAGAVQSATSEIMDVTAGETAPISFDESRFVLDVDAFMAAIIAPTHFITFPGKASFSKA